MAQKKNKRTKAQLLAENVALAADVQAAKVVLGDERVAQSRERVSWYETEKMLRRDLGLAYDAERSFRQMANDHATTNEKLRVEVKNLTAIATAIVGATGLEFPPLLLMQAVQKVLMGMGHVQNRDMIGPLQTVIGEGYSAGMKHGTVAMPANGAIGRNSAQAEADLLAEILRLTRDDRGPFPASLDEFFKVMEKSDLDLGGGARVGTFDGR